MIALLITIFSQTIKANLALLGAVTTWASAFAAIHLGLEGYSPGSLALIRYFVASMRLGLFFPRNVLKIKLQARHLLLLLGAGALGICGYSLLLNGGQKAVSSGLASFVIAQTPVMTAIFAIVLLNERPAFITIVGITISCIGVGVIVASEPLRLDFSFGLLMILSATLCGSLHTIFQKYLLKDLIPYHVTTFSTWFATAILLLIFLPHFLNQTADAPRHATMAAFFLGVIPSTIGQWLWSYGLAKTTVVRASAYLYTMPIISTIIAWFVLDERPSRYALMGSRNCAFWFNVGQKKRKTKEPCDRKNCEKSLTVRQPLMPDPY